MHTTSTWLALAEHAKALADEMTDAVERTALLRVAACYEESAWEFAAAPDLSHRFGGYH